VGPADPDPEKLTHAHVLRLIEDGSAQEPALILRYLAEMAGAFTPEEVMGVMALVDTPDVFD
jgi:hypothetical protein